ncbi:hypothetical protein BW723_03935 [Polaribacter reichenbachii]|uniref:HTH luxR-type domain-containing protein n=1 Tax=Polaribacter reichenbachii TaxID=996801 RepID=A0A1B8TVH3_9FLAO|nr:tetratricopeptide repeat protein [Polaribacter reichenbachii]APZ45499.1 hypothetical protein BW723_03935 [Polaribacter reichenbachii]AUC19360.1 hypothetical protein BTO17_11940 [Polaribacter reichenbachii]OBY63485.1 hypothetical protein LPB301_11770 [Polaribacter reichenbachii]
MKFNDINNNHYLTNKYFLGFLLLFLGCTFKHYSQDKKVKDPLYNKALSLKFSNQDSAIYYFKKGYNLRIAQKDTVGAIQQLMGLSDLYSHKLNYEKSYDGYWKALLLAEKSNDSISKSKIYIGLGWLYSFYKRDKKAIEYFNKSSAIRKGLHQLKKIHRSYLSQNYFAFVCHYRTNNNFSKARLYLDSLKQVKDSYLKSSKSFYYESEFGYLASLDGNHKTALKKLYRSKKYFENSNPSYLVVIHTLIAKVFLRMNDDKNAEKHFRKSLKISETYNSHLNYKLDVYNQLYQLSLKTNRYKKAIDYLLKAKDLDHKIFGINSLENAPLFEIKDQYRIEKDKQTQLFNQQKIKELEHEDKIWFLQSILLSITIISLILFGYFYFQKIREKHKNEKNLLKEKQKLELKKQKEIIEIKNKELTESALRIIEKDEFIDSINRKLKNESGKIDVNIIKRIIRNIQGNSKSNWSEFEARFTSINQSFYEELKTKFPNLRQSDLKLCALAKLNFSSKDMSKLLGISVESVHTSRSRLRKKLGLNRNDNLEEFINNL